MTAGVHAGTRALVTGGSQGIGLAIARRLVTEGCRNIVIASRDPDKGRDAAIALAELGAEAGFVLVEMGDTDSVLAMVAQAAARMGGVNALVNAAALTDRGGVLDTTPAEWDRMMAINARGPFFAIQRVAQLAIDRGEPASIVNILTMSAHCGQTFLAAYSASKGALSIATKNAANALRDRRIRVNGINCGWMDTPGEDLVQRRFHGAGDDWLAIAEAAQPFGQLVKPDHVAELASYMLGPNSGVMTGALVDFDQNVSGRPPE